MKGVRVLEFLFLRCFLSASINTVFIFCGGVDGMLILCIILLGLTKQETNMNFRDLGKLVFLVLAMVFIVPGQYQEFTSQYHSDVEVRAHHRTLHNKLIIRGAELERDGNYDCAVRMYDRAYKYGIESEAIKYLITKVEAEQNAYASKCVPTRIGTIRLNII